jgi:hypothetical protein
MTPEEPNNETYIKVDSESGPQPLKIVFCLPGKTYSDNFLKSWSELLYSLSRVNIIPIISQNYSPVVYWARNLCLGGSISRGISIKRFLSII